MIEIEDLNVVFGRAERGVHAVRDLSLRVEEGESFGLVGESGSGKSTVLRAIAGLITDWNGRISVAGQPQGKRRDRHFRRQVQMVFQDPYGSLHPRHTIDRILKEPLKIHRMEASRERIVQALEEVGLDATFRFRFPHQISGGQRQRIAVARALIMEPSVLFLDEPTSALDVSIQAEILNLLARLRRERGLTYLLVSHDLAVVGHMCERLAVMRQGQVVEVLAVEQLRQRTPDHPYTRRLFQAAHGYDPAFVAQLADEALG
jgi:peptide/nickel transport system ATP-binding protein